MDNIASECLTLLQKYKDGKANLEKRVIENEKWYKLQHWDTLRKTKDIVPTSAWTHNAIENKHADAMDNYPVPVVLPREKSDEQTAQILTSILPVILDANEFMETYSRNWYNKLKHGTAVYGIFWNSDKDNGLGDVDIKPIDLLKIFWEPGVTDIQKSHNLFICDLYDKDELQAMYPDKDITCDSSMLSQYQFDDAVDTTDKSLVVDWYYKTNNNGKQCVHLRKICGNSVLYDSTEDDNQDRNGNTIAEVGLYEHGLYPVVFDTMYPEEGTPVGFGVIAITKDPQMYIDRLSGNILENALMSTNKRYFISESAAINEQDFLDTTKRIVKVQGSLDDAKIKEIEVTPTASIDFNILQMKIDEMKETVGNRDVNSGGSGGATAAAAISAMQEAGNKISRDLISASYRAYKKIVFIVVELIRQFYDETRTFRITAPNGALEFQEFSNMGMRDVPLGDGYIRTPLFDYQIVAEKQNPFSRIQQNEIAKQFYQLGFFNPDQAQQSMIAMEMMSFEGKDKVMERIQQGSTLLEMVKQMGAELEAYRQMFGQVQQTIPQQSQPQQKQVAESDAGREQREILKAQTPMTEYGNKLAGKSVVDVNG